MLFAGRGRDAHFDRIPTGRSLALQSGARVQSPRRHRIKALTIRATNLPRPVAIQSVRTA